MTDVPILFSAPMVRALLREIAEPGTGKTETRRIIKGLPERSLEYDRRWLAAESRGTPACSPA